MRTSSLIDLSRKIADEAHYGQFRRDGVTPYFNHISRVVNRLDSQNESDEVLAAAALHDTLEDSEITGDFLIKSGIPESVVSVVEILTHKKGESYFWYIDRIAENPIARKVKIADILDNLSGSPTERQIIKYARALLKLHGRG